MFRRCSDNVQTQPHLHHFRLPRDTCVFADVRQLELALDGPVPSGQDNHRAVHAQIVVKGADIRISSGRREGDA
jgi:hypothetical protein